MLRIANQSTSDPRRALLPCATLGLCLLLVACERPQPRSFADFMEDSIARDGTLARCNEDPAATLQDIECAHARRASSAIALRQERDRRETFERESQRKIEELKLEMVERERIAREAALAAARAEREAYEAMWRRSGLIPDDVFGPESAPAPTGGVPTPTGDILSLATSAAAVGSQ
jgi:hypothetical protein